MIPHPPTSTLFPYTTLFRSHPDAIRSGFREGVRKRDFSGGANALRVVAVRLHCGRLLFLRRLMGLPGQRSEEHTSELQSRENLVCRLLLEKKKKQQYPKTAA